MHWYLRESQLYRIDHFLGKMGLVEILYLPYANTMFEPIWNRNYVASVQITMAESFGVEDRGRFYDPVGALRNIVVNHLMQVIAATAMEPPSSRDGTTLKNAMVSVFQAMAEGNPAHYVRGQYDGYLDTDGVAADSTTETYAALRLDIDNWRWSGVPFFIRTGKHLPITQTELVGFGPSVRAREAEPGRVLEDEPQLGLRDRQVLAGADEERHARPAPVVDLQAHRRVGLGRGVRRHAVDVAVAVVLAAHVVRRVAAGIAWKTDTMAFFSVVASPPAGGSIAVAATTCMRWLTTTSRSAPTGS